MKKFIALDGERVTLIHYMPFDSINGMHKTEAELAQMGVLLDEIPDPEQIEGKIPVACYNATDGFHYIYEDAPVTTDDRVAALEDAMLEMMGVNTNE